MTEEKSTEKRIENWILMAEQYEKNPNYIIPKLRGIVQGEDVTFPIYWLDTEEGIAMTEEAIYRLGKPNRNFLNAIHSNGGKLSDLDIKGTTH